MINMKDNKGITMVVLMLAIVIMIIIASTLIFNAQTGAKTRALNNMYNDIKILSDKVDIYYSQYGALPILQTKYTNVDNIKEINVNDNQNYYVIDLELLENVTLAYGKDYASYKSAPNQNLKDIYIINEQSHTIYYVEGMSLDNNQYHTVVSDYTKVETSLNCNHPKLGEGMMPVKWNGTNFVQTNSYDVDWYNYTDTSVTGKENTSKWANAQTKDGSMWVWIPRYAYKITYKNASDKSLGGTIDVVFLKDNTNNDFNGNDVTSANYVDEKGGKGAYIVHPSFQNGTKNGFANGEWDNEITGFWVAKFEAGYAGTAGDPTSAQDSTVKLSTIQQWNGSANADLTKNYYGTRAIGDKIKYPLFQANRPCMNNLGISDAYDLSRSLTAIGNPYGLSNVDSHMLKNSEWGAISYLTHSKYGRNGKEVTVNNISVENENTIYGVTGYGAVNVSAPKDTTRTLATLMKNNQAGSWSTSQGQNASSTGNVYGIYDLSGGTGEWTAGYVATGSYNSYAKSLKGESSKYKSRYAGISDIDTTNYKEIENIKRIGEAIWETSVAGTGNTSWNGDSSYFWCGSWAFSRRGGDYGRDDIGSSGVFAFHYNTGICHIAIGFRPAIIVE